MLNLSPLCPSALRFVKGNSFLTIKSHLGRNKVKVCVFERVVVVVFKSNL